MGALESHCRCLTLVSRNHCRSRVLANHFEDCTVPSARTMQSMQEHARTRPRVSRACERCRIKKAKLFLSSRTSFYVPAGQAQESDHLTFNMSSILATSRPNPAFPQCSQPPADHTG